MFGQTKRQFLKKSKKALQDTGMQMLSLRDLMKQESSNQIGAHQANRKLDVLRRDVEETFNVYEKMNPPSLCLPLYHRVLNGLIVFFDSLVTYSEYLQEIEEKNEVFQEKKEKVRDNLLRYQDISLKLSKEVDRYLYKK